MSSYTIKFDRRVKKDFKSIQDIEMEINVKKLNLESAVREFSKSELKQRLLKEIENQKIINFNKYKISDIKPELLLVSSN